MWNRAKALFAEQLLNQACVVGHEPGEVEALEERIDALIREAGDFHNGIWQNCDAFHALSPTPTFGHMCRTLDADTLCRCYLYGHLL